MALQTKMTAKQARDNFTDLLGAVYYGNQVVEIDKKGRTFAVVVNPNEYNALKMAAKGKFFEIVEDIQMANRGKDSSRALYSITSTVEKIRQKRYDAKK